MKHTDTRPGQKRLPIVPVVIVLALIACSAMATAVNRNGKYGQVNVECVPSGYWGVSGGAIMLNGCGPTHSTSTVVGREIQFVFIRFEYWQPLRAEK